MDIQKLCPGCMNKIDDIETRAVCPHCNYDLKSTNKKPYHLKPYTMLGEQEKRYMVGRAVGEGAFGVTYIGYDTKLEMKVAIKEFYPKKFASRDTNITTVVELHKQQSFDIEELREDSIGEAKNLAKLDKLDGVVEVKDYFRDNNTIYIVMEYIDGTTLKTYLVNNGGRISVSDAKQMIKPVMGSLIKVHESGMIHRDISPDNIMVTKEGKMKLIDFGTAKEEQGNDKVLLGKGGYAPIEQYSRGGNQGPWTDVYALAATFYNCITGQKPPTAKERAQNDTIKSPREYGVHMGDIEENALMVALNVEPNDRFQSMHALYNAFYTQVQQEQSQTNHYQQPQYQPQPQVQQQYQPQSQVQQQYQPQPQVQQQYQQQPQVQQQYQQQPQIQQQYQSQSQFEREITSKPKSSKGIIVAAVVIIAVIAAVGGIVFFRSSGNDEEAETSIVSAEGNSDEKVETNSSDSESGSKSESEPSGERTANMDLLDDISDLIDEGKYEKAIDTLNENNDVFEEVEMDTARSLMSKAVKSQIESATSEADSYAGKNQYAEALSSLENMKDYIASLENESLSSEYANTQSLDNKYDMVLGKYKSYLSSTGLKYANSGNDNSVNSMFATADNYFDGDEYEQIKNNVYTYLVIANANNYIADGSALSQGITYVRNNVEKTGYNCWVIEYLDVMREQYRVQNNQRNMTVILQNVINGYILPDSNTSYLTENDISYLSQYELYMAYFEIYARHGRTFSDTVVNDYFNGLSWYKGTTAPASFNETQLNEYEKSNAILIYKYQVRMGYR